MINRIPSVVSDCLLVDVTWGSDDRDLPAPVLRARPGRLMADWALDVDHEGCFGSGLCTSAAPDRFTLAADGRAEAVDTAIDEDPAVVTAAALCPAEAITIVEIGSGTVLAGPAW